jgi:predicted MFS family arabinose efflux permease
MKPVGAYFAFRLHEAPRSDGSQEEERLSAFKAVTQLAHNIEARWLVLLGAILSTATYLAFWLSAPYYQALGIPVVWFSAILAARSLWKAWLSHRGGYDEKRVEKSLIGYIALAGLVYLAMASQQQWLVWAVLGHDVVQVLSSQPLRARLNAHISHRHRATLNSVANLVQRLFYTVAGPLAGLAVDRYGLSTGFVLAGTISSLAATIAFWRLRRLGAFRIA